MCVGFSGLFSALSNISTLVLGTTGTAQADSNIRTVASFRDVRIRV